VRRGLSIVVVMGGMFAARWLRPHSAKVDARMKGAYRHPASMAGRRMALEGTPAEIVFQHGALLASEIADLQKVFALELSHDTGKDGNSFALLRKHDVASRGIRVSRRDAGHCGRTQEPGVALDCGMSWP